MAGPSEVLRSVLPMVMQQRRMEQEQAQQAQQMEFRRRLQQEEAAREDAWRRQQMMMQGAREDRALRSQENLEAHRTRGYQAQEAAANKRLEAAMAGTLKPGYRWDETKTKQIPVEGGPAWRELQSKHAKDLDDFAAIREQTAGAQEPLGYLLNPKNKDALNSLFGGYNAYLTQYLPGQTQDARTKLEALKASMKAAGLRVVRGGGGSVGAITEREWPIMERLIDNLTPTMSEEEARNSLRQIQGRLNRMQEHAKRVYGAEWSDSPFYKPELLEAPQVGPDPRQQRLEELRRKREAR